MVHETVLIISSNSLLVQAWDSETTKTIVKRFSPYSFQSGMKLLSSTSKIIFKGFRREYVWKNYVKLARQESKP